MNSRFKSIWYHMQARRALQRRRIGFGIACLKKLARIAPHRAIALIVESVVRIAIPLGFRNRVTMWYGRTFKAVPGFYRQAKESGVNKVPRSERIVVTLTSYPKRIGTIHKVINTLLTQTYKPDTVVLWLAPEQFPNREDDLPRELLALKAYGLTIDWYHDIRSFKKLIPALKKYPDACLVTADDDIYYPPDWLEELVEAHHKYPRCVVCHGAHRIRFEKDGSLKPYRKWTFGVGNCDPAFNVFVTCGAGALYSPGVLHQDVLRENIFRELCPNADDIWFWSMALHNGTRIKVVDNHVRRLNDVLDADASEALCTQNMMIGNQNDVQLARVIAKYPDIMEKIRG